MKLEGRVGAISAAVGTANPLTTNKYGALITVPSGGPLSEAALAGRLFSAGNSAAVATTAAMTGTWTGLCISNPTGNTFNIIMHEFSWALTVVGPDDGSVGLFTCTIAAPAAVIVPTNQLRGSGIASTAYVDDGATVVGGVMARLAGSIGTGATNLVWGNSPNVLDLKGGLIITPGYTLATYTTTATTAAAMFNFVWEEVPV